MEAEVPEHWKDDVLDRRAIGNFLYRLCLMQYQHYHSTEKGGALCIAIDADWGAGKSFFVQRWQKDLKAQGHPVIDFDAWANDLSDDPLIAFMAHLQKGLEDWSKQHRGLVGRAGQAASSKLKAVMDAAPRAILPALAVVGKAVIKKASGVSVEDLQSAYEHGISICKDDFADEAQGMGKEALQAFFEEALKSHTGKQAAIKELQGSIAALLAFMRDEEAAKLPLFIFVDELDRCRPDYAIRLLEGVKHLFNVQGVCFVFTTNMTQLAASTKAIYGGDFDGFRYLKRLFSFEYRLPEPSTESFARMLVQESAMAKWQGKVYSGLPSGRADQNAVDGLAAAFAAIASSFELDLRSQKQVFRLSDIVTAQMDSSKTLYALYLFALATVAFRQPVVLDEVIAGKRGIQDQLARLRPVQFQFPYFDHARSEHRQQQLSVRELISLYVDLAPMTFEQALTHLQQNESSRGDFARLKTALMDDQPWQYSAQGPLRFSDYPRIVRHAGNLAAGLGA